MSSEQGRVGDQESVAALKWSRARPGERVVTQERGLQLRRAPTDRRKMMQAWADYLDALKASADVIPLFIRSTRKASRKRTVGLGLN